MNTSDQQTLESLKPYIVAVLREKAAEGAPFESLDLLAIFKEAVSRANAFLREMVEAKTPRARALRELIYQRVYDELRARHGGGR